MFSISEVSAGKRRKKKTTPANANARLKEAEVSKENEVCLYRHETGVAELRGGRIVTSEERMMRATVRAQRDAATRFDLGVKSANWKFRAHSARQRALASGWQEL
ncbi:hypothetical protein MTO96_014834 [Rhipicephalus appendiculatus]